MPQDQTLLLRKAIVTQLRADDDLVDLVPEERIYGMRSPSTLTWPFVRYGTPDTEPVRATCWDGSKVSISIHAFSKEEFEDQVAGVLSAIATALGDKVLILTGEVRAYMRWMGSTIIPDGAEASAWHGIARFEATIS